MHLPCWGQNLIKSSVPRLSLLPWCGQKGIPRYTERWVQANSSLRIHIGMLSSFWNVFFSVFRVWKSFCPIMSIVKRFVVQYSQAAHDKEERKTEFRAKAVVSMSVKKPTHITAEQERIGGKSDGSVLTGWHRCI